MLSPPPPVISSPFFRIVAISLSFLLCVSTLLSCNSLSLAANCLLLYDGDVILFVDESSFLSVFLSKAALFLLSSMFCVVRYPVASPCLLLADFALALTYYRYCNIILIPYARSSSTNFRRISHFYRLRPLRNPFLNASGAYHPTSPVNTPIAMRPFRLLRSSIGPTGSTIVCDFCIQELQHERPKFNT